MAEKLAKGVRCSQGNLYQFIPPIATKDEFGGIKANARTTETKEVVIDEKTGRLYVDDFGPISNEFQTNINSLQNQIDNIVIETSNNSDATAEVVQARVVKDGTNYPTLKDRLDAEHTETENLKVALDNQNSVDLLDVITETNSRNGITYTPLGNGTYHVKGTTTDASFLYLVQSAGTIPSNLKPGGKYKLNFNTTDSTITLRIYRYYTDGTNDYESYGNPADKSYIILPENLKGISIRLNIANGRTVDGIVSARLLNASSNQELDDNIEALEDKLLHFNSKDILEHVNTVIISNGVTFEPQGNGDYHVYGTATENAFSYLIHSPGGIPSTMELGKKYKLHFNTTDSYITLRVYRYFSDGTEDYVSYGNKDDGKFITIPEDLIGISIRLNVGEGRTVDGTVSVVLFNALSNKDLEEKLDDMYVAKNCNLVNIASVKSSSYVTVSRNDDGSITLETTAAAERAFVKIPLPSEAFQPQKSYYLYIKVDSCESSASSYIAMRFVGTYEGTGKLSNGINTFGKPGEYCSLVYTHGYENALRLYITGSTAATAKVVVSRIMVAESDIALPYVPYGNTVVDANAIATLSGLKNVEKSWAVSNVLAHAHQLAHIRFTPLNTLPGQFGDFAAGKEVMGLPYSSARAVDKLIGTHISIHTFMSAIANPRSVVYTRYLTTRNAKTYYGIVCSAFTNYCFGVNDVNLTTADYRNWDKVHEKPYTSLKIGDVMINDGHIILITDLIRDSYGRITNVSYTEAGSPVIRVVEGQYWNKFVAERTESGYKAYSYEDIENTVYTPSPFVKGYADDVVEGVVFPDIMSEYGDKCCLLAGESTNINVINAKDYTTITVSLNGEVVDTRTDIVDFEITNLLGGEYEITLSNGSTSSTTKFFVVDATCSYDSETHIVSFASTNATPCACYVYDDNPVNKYVELTAENIETGTVDVSEFVSETHQYVKVGFSAGEYGVATWYSHDLHQWEYVS